jgi:hypothetical protein
MSEQSDIFLKALQERLYGDVSANKEKSSYKIRIVTKRTKRSEQFAEISKANVGVVDELIAIAEQLANDGNGSEAAKIIKIIKKLLDNNQKLQLVVGEALLDIPN